MNERYRILRFFSYSALVSPSYPSIPPTSPFYDVCYCALRKRCGLGRNISTSWLHGYATNE